MEHQLITKISVQLGLIGSIWQSTQAKTSIGNTARAQPIPILNRRLVIQNRHKVVFVNSLLGYSLSSQIPGKAKMKNRGLFENLTSLTLEKQRGKQTRQT